MSSTNRGTDRHAADYYVTPQWAISNFLKAARADGLFADLPLKVLDPCAGGDANTEMSYPAVLLREGWPMQLTTVDWRTDSRAEIKGDFLGWQTPERFDLVITNPPFIIAQEVIDRSLELCRDGGYVVMLLRLNFFGGAKRFDWWQRTMPAYAYVHNRRLSFTGGPTDSIEYMHAVWQKGSNPSHTKLKVI